MILTPKDLGEQLKRGRVSPVYLIVGDVPYRMAEAAHYLSEQVEKATGKPVDRHVFSMSEGGRAVIDGVLTACNTFSMFGSTQVVTVEDVPLAMPAKRKTKKKAGDDDEGGQTRLPAEWVAYCEAPCPSTVLILRAQPKAFKRRDLEPFEALGAVVFIEEEAGAALEERIVKRGRRLGVTIEPDAARLLLERLGNDLGLVQGEIDRLALVAHPDPRVTRELVDDQVGDVREYQVFDIIDPLTSKDRAATIHVIEALLADGEDPVKLLAVIAGGLRDAWLARLAPDPATARQLLGRNLPDFVLRKLAGQGQRLSDAAFRAVWACLWDTDRRLKSIRLPSSDKGEMLFQFVIDVTA